MEQPLDERTTRRVILVGRFAVLWALIIVARLTHLQVVRHDEYVRAARMQQQHVYFIPPDRGEILDRRGAPLAISIRTESLVINPQLVKKPAFFAQTVAPILGLNARALAAEILDLQRRERGYMLLKRHVTREEKERLAGQPFRFFEYQRDYRREYPAGHLAAHVVGSLNSEMAGNSGLEQKLDKLLKGKPGRVRALTDSLQSRYQTWVENEGEQGANVTTTIHRVIQHEAESALQRGVQAAHARSGTVVVMDPRNGEILALANFPSFDPRVAPRNDQEFKSRKSAAVMDPVEPGSVMKMITVTMGLDSGRFQETTPVYCENGAFPRPGRRAIHDAHRYGVLDVAGVLIKSSNIGVAKISIQCGPRLLYDYLKRFGMGERTGIELPGETGGMLRHLDCRGPADGWCWTTYSHEYIAFGHEIGATAVQLARAVSVIANGGLLVKPHVVLKAERIRPGAEPEVLRPETPARRVLRAETAFQVRRIMQRVVLEGTGKRAHIPGYTAGGKTGSAEMYVEGVGWARNRHNSSFIGFAPVTNPRVVVVVTLGDTPLQGGIAAAPVFRDIMGTALRVLNVPKDDPDSDIDPLNQVPENRIEIKSLPDERIAEVKPPAPPETAPSEPVFDPLVAGPRVPDFRGKPVVAVLRESASRGMPVEIVGSGLARAQKPAPGEILPAGGKVHIEFARP